MKGRSDLLPEHAFWDVPFQRIELVIEVPRGATPELSNDGSELLLEHELLNYFWDNIQVIKLLIKILRETFLN